MTDDLISRQVAIMAIREWYWSAAGVNPLPDLDDMETTIFNVPSAEPTLYGYKIEHLAYIARVMEKEGITAEDAARTFSDLGRAVFLAIDEALQKLEEAVRT